MKYLKRNKGDERPSQKKKKLEKYTTNIQPVKVLWALNHAFA